MSIAQPRRILSQALELLYVEPTPQLWELIIRYALNGLLDHELDLLGGVEGYFAAKIRANPDPSGAESTFRRGLDAVSRSWNIEESETGIETERKLSLIRVYLPPAGLDKILGRLQRRFEFYISPALDRETHTKLVRLALRALEGYFSGPTKDLDAATETAQKSYVSLLESITLNNDRRSFWGHAFVRLLELGQWQFADPHTIDYLLTHYSDLLTDVVPWLLRSQWPQRVRFLSILRLLAGNDSSEDTSEDSSKAERMLRMELKRAGAHLYEADGVSHIVIRFLGETTDTVKLDLTEEETNRLVQPVLEYRLGDGELDRKRDAVDARINYREIAGAYL